MSRVDLGRSFLVALRGIYWAISKDRNTKIHIFLGIFTLLIAIFLQITRIELMIIAIISFLVISLELFNNCIEKLIDAISTEHNKEFGRIKDVLSGIVLSVDFLAVLIGLLIFYKPFIMKFGLNPYIPFKILFVLNFFMIGIALLILLKRKN